MQRLLEQAIVFATEAHAGQKDRLKMPYILHPMRVSGRCWVYGVEHSIVGILHDVVEDCPVVINPCTPLSLFRPNLENYTRCLLNTQNGSILPLPDEIADAVEAITQNKDEDHGVYLERCCRNLIARSVKREDMQDNYGRLFGLNPEKQEQLRDRYIAGLRYVLNLDLATEVR